jgi:hypothetical protein
MRRTFIVGCPRSGTTVVQAMLGRHPEVLTLPETALFEHLLGGLAWRWGDRDSKAPRQRARHRLGFARRRGRRAYEETMRLLGNDATGATAPLRTETCIDRFIGMLDTCASEAGRSMWLEKTPNHLLYIEEITAHLPDAQFVHVIRPGIDVMASITDANLHFDDNHGFGGGTKLWAHRWNRAMSIHRRYVGQPNHHFIFLDDFTKHTDAQWRRLCHALSLDPELPLDDACAQPIANLSDEPWKHAAVSGKPKAQRSKVDDLFGPALQRWLEQRLVSLEALRDLCAEADIALNEASTASKTHRRRTTTARPAAR